jgi:hypothetical protein
LYAVSRRVIKRIKRGPTRDEILSKRLPASAALCLHFTSSMQLPSVQHDIVRI